MKEIEKNHLNISKLKRKQNKTTKSQKLGRLNYPLKLDPLCQVTEGRDLHLPSAKDSNAVCHWGYVSYVSYVGNVQCLPFCLQMPFGMSIS